MKYIKVLMLFGILSCSSYKIVEEDIKIHNGVRIESDFLPHVRKFENYCEKKVHVPMYFINDMPFDVTGVCLGFGLPEAFRMIIIDKEWWDNNWHRAYEEVLIMHEIGHCVLNRWHNNTKENRVPVSYMHSPLFYPHWKIDYMSELCNK